MKKFQLYLSFSKHFYIPVSLEVISYIESKVITEILEKKKIITNSNSTYILSVKVSEKNYPNYPKDITIWDRKSGDYKLNGAVCSRDNINENEPLNKEIINLVLRCLKLFFEKYFKKVKPEDYEAFLKQIDLNYLYSLPFPSTVPQECFSGDVVYMPKAVY